MKTSSNTIRILSVLLLVTSGCNRIPTIDISNSRNTIIHVDFPDNKAMFRNADSLVKHIDSCSFIQLETNAQCLIGEITKTIIHKNRLYILDCDVTQAVYVYDLEGNWISTIAKKGHGPGEYINITDMYIDKANSTLNLVAFANKKIMRFDLTGEKLLDEIPLSISIMNAESFPNGAMVGYSNSNNQSNNTSPQIFCFEDKDLSSIHYAALPIPSGWKDTSLGGGSVLSNQNETIYYLEPLQNKVYKIEPDSIYLMYTFDFKDLNPDTEMTSEEFLKISPFQRNRTILKIDRLSLLSDGMVIEVKYQGKRKLVFFSDNYQKAEPYLITNNPLLKPLPFGYSVSLADGVLITQLRPDQVQNWIKRDDYATKYPESAKITQRNIRKPILEDDNPILCIYHVK